MSGWRRWWPAVFLALVPLVPLGRAIVRGEAIGPFDKLRVAVIPFREPAGCSIEDAATQFAGAGGVTVIGRSEECGFRAALPNSRDQLPPKNRGHKLRIETAEPGDARFGPSAQPF